MKQGIISWRGNAMRKSTFAWLIVLMALCGGLLCSSAVAGHWEVGCDVTYGYKSPSSAGFNRKETIPASPDGYDDLQQFWAGETPNYGFKSYSPFLIWKPDIDPSTGQPLNDPPPDHVSVKITASTSADGQAYYDGVLATTAPTLTTYCNIGQQQEILTFPDAYNHDIATNTISAGTSLMTLRTNGLKPVHLPTEPNLHASVDGDEATYGGGDMWFSCAIQIDNREVFITSDKEANYRREDTNALPPELYRSDTPPTGPGPYAVLNVRQPDKTITVDAVAEYKTLNIAGYDDPVNWWVAGGMFYAATPNFQTPTNYKWTLNGKPKIWLGDPGYVDFHTDFVSDDGSIIFGEQLPSSAKSIIGVEVTDQADGAVGKNTYTVRWHKPFEGYQDIAVDRLPRDDTIRYYGDTCDVIAGGDIKLDGTPLIFTIHKTFLGTLQDYLQGGLDVLSLPATLVDPEWQFVLMALKEAGPIDDGDVEVSATQNFSDYFTKAKEFGIVPQDAVFDQWVLVHPFAYAQYHVSDRRGDTYGQNGWIKVDDRIQATEFAAGISGEYRKIDLGD